MTAAKSLLLYDELFRKQKISKVLDYGAGTLRNTAYLLEAGYEVVIVDLPQQLAKVMNRPEIGKAVGVYDINQVGNCSLGVDLVTCNFVFNIIDDPGEREELLNNVYNNLRYGGYFLLDVVRKKECEDGFGGCVNKEFCHAYTLEEMDQMILPVGFRRVNFLIRDNFLSVLYQRCFKSALLVS
ncbi:MAG: class I SAM-dependent methyltransferase [Clostridia bacterium]|nr:class I SAM-dependent methyltransferase [Clostridia bacterium]